MIDYKLHHVNGLYFEITSDTLHNRFFDIVITDEDLNTEIYKTKLGVGGWLRLNRKYLSNLCLKVSCKDELILEKHILDEIKYKKVFISFDSSSLGDNLAWIPVCEEFRKQYECQLVVSTFKNFLFEKSYPNIEFVNRGVVVNDIFAMFELGWFYNTDKEPVHPATISLQDSAKKILYVANQTELIADIDIKQTSRPHHNKFVCISTQSTAQLKLWYYWQDLVDWLLSQGYDVFEVSKDSCDLQGTSSLDDKSLDSVSKYIYYCDFFIGLSSGLSWLAWAMRKRVYMIANFSKSDHEFQSNCIRIINDKVCNGCWNNPMFKFDKGNWNYCPEHEDTPRQFECHKSISAADVISAIQKHQPKNIF